MGFSFIIRSFLCCLFCFSLNIVYCTLFWCLLSKVWDLEVGCGGRVCVLGVVFTRTNPGRAWTTLNTLKPSTPKLKTICNPTTRFTLTHGRATLNPDPRTPPPKPKTLNPNPQKLNLNPNIAMTVGSTPNPATLRFTPFPQPLISNPIEFNVRRSRPAASPRRVRSRPKDCTELVLFTIYEFAASSRMYEAHTRTRIPTSPRSGVHVEGLRLRNCGSELRVGG